MVIHFVQVSYGAAFCHNAGGDSLHDFEEVRIDILPQRAAPSAAMPPLWTFSLVPKLQLGNQREGGARGPAQG
ncbi:MAG: hypothetical protein C4519_16270 [Desulfobacteraceae bacterium]|nr:MAG: hypothetical protein C4519_16270 [Desulfobacteraceae bacterium]